MFGGFLRAGIDCMFYKYDHILIDKIKRLQGGKREAIDKKQSYGVTLELLIQFHFLVYGILIKWVGNYRLIIPVRRN